MSEKVRRLTQNSRTVEVHVLSHRRPPYSGCNEGNASSELFRVTFTTLYSSLMETIVLTLSIILSTVHCESRAYKHCEQCIAMQ